MRVGIDIIEFAGMEDRMKRGTGFVEKILDLDECGDWELPTIAGKIAAKEAIIKTGFMKAGQWKNVKIVNDETGRPVVYDTRGARLDNIQISISHSENYVIAIAIYHSFT